MKKSILAIMLAGTVSLGACASNPNIARNAGIGGLGGAAVGAVIPGVSVAEGAIAGAAIGGLSGALWTDQNNDGYVDGYTRTANIMRARRRAMTRPSAASPPAPLAVPHSAPLPVRSSRASASFRAR